MNVLIACEVSQTICQEFRALGHNAFSCDLQPCGGLHPEWHIQADAIETAYNKKYKWDLMIAHPPCTYLALSGYNIYKNKPEWVKNTEPALEFVRKLMDVPIGFICIENPVSIISSKIRKPDQIIQPYYFGDSFQKTTCLWLKNLPHLKYTKIVDKGEFKEWTDKNGKKKRQALWIYQASGKKDRNDIRSKTFPGIAKAIACQWGNVKKEDIPKKLF